MQFKVETNSIKKDECAGKADQALPADGVPAKHSAQHQDPTADAVPDPEEVVAQKQQNTESHPVVSAENHPSQKKMKLELEGGLEQRSIPYHFCSEQNYQQLQEKSP